MSENAFTDAADNAVANVDDALPALWSLLREHGFDAAERHVAALVSSGAASLQLHADLCASDERFEAAYHSASQAAGETRSGARHVRLALFADALGRAEAAQRHSERAVTNLTAFAAREWIVWLGERCGAHAAALRMLDAYEQREAGDARAPWWRAVLLAAVPGERAKTARRAALLRAYALDPAVHSALPLQLVLACREQRDWDAVERISRERLAADPADAEMAWQLSYAQWQRNDAASAEATLRAVAERVPDNAALLGAIGMYLTEQCRFADSEAALHASLALDPAGATPAVDLAELALRRDDWSAAWPCYEARLARDDREPNNVVTLMAQRAPRWRREPLGGKILLVHSEQGNGDDIQMVRFVPELAARVRDEGGRLVLAVRRPLHALLSRCYGDCVAIEDGLNGFDFRPDFILPMMSVPYVIDLQPGQVSGAAYLHADADKVAAWRARVNAGANAGAVPEPSPTLRVGLVWSGSPTHRRDSKRSIPLAALAPVLALPGIVFYPLTPTSPGGHAGIAALNAQGCQVRDLTADYIDGFDDVAALVSVLDTVLTIDSAPLHLAGALGRPALGMLDRVSHWCWGGEETQRWYDSIELFRQPNAGDWTPVVERVAARLRALADARADRRVE